MENRFLFLFFPLRLGDVCWRPRRPSLNLYSNLAHILRPHASYPVPGRHLGPSGAPILHHSFYPPLQPPIRHLAPRAAHLSPLQTVLNGRPGAVGDKRGEKWMECFFFLHCRASTRHGRSTTGILSRKEYKLDAEIPLEARNQQAKTKHQQKPKHTNQQAPDNSTTAREIRKTK